MTKASKVVQVTSPLETGKSFKEGTNESKAVDLKYYEEREDGDEEPSWAYPYIPPDPVTKPWTPQVEEEPANYEHVSYPHALSGSSLSSKHIPLAVCANIPEFFVGEC